MKILIISSYVPYPLYSGGQVRLYNLIKELSTKHDITLIAEKRSKHILTHKDMQQLEQICKKVIVVPSPKQWSLRNVIHTGFSSHSFLITGHTHTTMQEKITSELKNTKFDVIHIETFYVIQNLPRDYEVSRISEAPRVSRAPIVLVEHNIEYQVYQKFLQRAPVITRPLLQFDIAKIRREEEAAWQRASKIVVVSHEDKKVIEHAGVHATIVSNGVDTKEFTYKDLQRTFNEKIKKILFIGDFKWIQNRDTAAWIIREIWPLITADNKIQKKAYKTKLWIIGRAIPNSLKNLTQDPDILFDEKNSIKPTHELFQQATVLLAPIRIGGGTSYKILESMACGSPTIITSLSANALQARDGEHAMVADTAEGLAKKTISLLQNQKLYTAISKNGRSLVENKYTWRSIAMDLEKVYKSVI